MKRRHWLIGGAGAAALLAGIGLARWRFGVEAGPASADAQIWGLSFDQPDGAVLRMADLRGRPLLVNFWATWCPPCIEELPLIDAFYRQHAANGWQVVGLAVDQPGAVRTFLGKTPLGFPIGIAGLGGTELSKALGNRSGALPFSVVYGADGTVRARKLGQLKAAELNRWAELK